MPPRSSLLIITDMRGPAVRLSVADDSICPRLLPQVPYVVVTAN